MEYPLQVIYFSTPLALLLVVLGRFASWTGLVLLISLLLRWSLAWLISGWTENRSMRRWLALLPLQDCMHAVAWLAGAVGEKVTWRGQEYRVLEDGKLTVAGQSVARIHGGVN